MPIFEVESGGKVYEVDAPSAAAAGAAFGTPQGSPQGAPTSAAPAPAGPAPAPAAATPPEGLNPLNLGGDPHERLKAELEKNPYWAKFAGGFGSAATTAYQGVKQLLGGNVDEQDIKDQRALQDVKGGTLGNIAGNVAMTALPMGAAERGLTGAAKMAGVMKGSPNLTRALASTGLAGAEGAALTPTIGEESRAANAAKSAALTGGVLGAGRVLTQAVRPSKSAEALMEKGIQPTVGQGAGGGIGKAMGYAEDLVNAIPLLNSVTKGGRDRAEEEAVKMMARRASPYNAAPESLGEITRGTWFTKQDKAFDTGYKEVLDNQTIRMGGLFKSQVRQSIDPLLGGMSSSARRGIEQDLVDTLGKTGRMMSGPEWHETFKEVRRLGREADSAVAKTSSRDARNEARVWDAVEKQMLDARKTSINDNSLVERLANLDESYAHNKVFQQAADYAKAAGEGGVRLEHIMKAVEANTPSAIKVRASGRMQDITEPAASVFKQTMGQDALERRAANVASGKALGVLGLGGAASYGAMGPAGLIALPAIVGGAGLGTTKTGAKLMFGNTAAQKAAAKLLRGREASIGSAYPLNVNSEE